MREGFFKKVVLPVALIALLLTIFIPICTIDGKLEYFYLWILVGIPFGVRRMFLWLIPSGYDLGGTVGIVAFNFIIGGLIGGVFAILALVQAAWYCVSSVFRLICRLVSRGDYRNKV